MATPTARPPSPAQVGPERMVAMLRTAIYTLIA